MHPRFRQPSVLPRIVSRARQMMLRAAPLIVTAWLAACAMPYHSDVSAPPPDPFNPAATQLLDDTQWQLASWQHADGSVIDVPQGDASDQARTAITLDLSTSGGQRRVSGFAGCNQYTGAYVLKNGLLSFNQLQPASTRMACEEAGTKLESAYLAALAHIVHSGVQIPNNPCDRPRLATADCTITPPQRLLLQPGDGDRLTFVQRLPQNRTGN